MSADRIVSLLWQIDFYFIIKICIGNDNIAALVKYIC